MNNTKTSKFLYCLIFLSVVIFISCSTNDDNDVDSNPDQTSFETVSQNKVNQEFYIEAIQISGPSSPQSRTVPHSSKLPLFQKSNIELHTDINVNEVAFITLIGQRLSKPLVTDREDITWVSTIGEPYDSAVITFVISNDVNPNAVFTINESVVRETTPFNDHFAQTNTIITDGRITVTLKDPNNHVLGNTLNDDGSPSEPIESITFIANPSAFQDPNTSLNETNGTMVVKWLGNFQTFYDNLFTTLSSKDIAIIRRINGINGIKNKRNFYGLPNN